jgi:predicted metal-dependent hydrolase
MTRHHELPTRRPEFSWADRDVQHWIPGHPYAAHVLNAMHLGLPAGERAFCRVLGSAEAHIEDPAVREAVRGFIAQEAQHARTHARAGVHLAEVNTRVVTAGRLAEGTVHVLFGKKRTHNRYLLVWRLALVAAAEHLTTALGEWIMVRARLDEYGADRDMLTLFAWHGAEEVEHRSVAFDAHAAVQKRGLRLTRMAAMALCAPVTLGMWMVTAQHLAWGDRNLPGRRLLRPAHLRRGADAGVLPDLFALLRGAAAFTRRDYHPHTHVTPETAAAADAYLASDEMQRVLAG